MKVKASYYLAEVLIEVPYIDNQFALSCVSKDEDYDMNVRERCIVPRILF